MKSLKSILKLSDRIVGINARNRELVYPSNARKDFKLANDKILTKQFLYELEMPVPEFYTSIHRIGDLHSKWNEMRKYDSLAIKPANGKGGGGILVLYQNHGAWCSGSGKKVDDNTIIKHMANIIFGVFSFGSSDAVLIEYRVNSHSFFKEIYPDGVPDARIITYNGEILNGMLRIPSKTSDGKANLHQGAIGVSLNMESGILEEGYDYKSYFDAHPDTNNVFKGKQLPYWNEIVQMSLTIADNCPLKYLGIDIVLDEDKGPLVMELNARPGIEIQNVTKRGINELLNKKKTK